MSEGAEEGFLNIFKMSILVGLERAEDVKHVTGVDDDEVVAIEGLDGIEGFLRTRPGVADIFPNNLTPSDLMGSAVAGEDDIGADGSSIDPNVITGPEKNQYAIGREARR